LSEGTSFGAVKIFSAPSRPATTKGQPGKCPPRNFPKDMFVSGTATSYIILPPPHEKINGQLRNVLIFVESANVLLETHFTFSRQNCRAKLCTLARTFHNQSCW